LNSEKISQINFGEVVAERRGVLETRRCAGIIAGFEALDTGGQDFSGFRLGR
jgi:hypothetical protein